MFGFFSRNSGKISVGSIIGGCFLGAVLYLNPYGLIVGSIAATLKVICAALAFSGVVSTADFFAKNNISVTKLLEPSEMKKLLELTIIEAEKSDKTNTSEITQLKEALAQVQDGLNKELTQVKKELYDRQDSASKINERLMTLEMKEEERSKKMPPSEISVKSDSSIVSELTAGSSDIRPVYPVLKVNFGTGENSVNSPDPGTHSSNTASSVDTEQQSKDSHKTDSLVYPTLSGTIANTSSNSSETPISNLCSDSSSTYSKPSVTSSDESGASDSYTWITHHDAKEDGVTQIFNSENDSASCSF